MKEQKRGSGSIFYVGSDPRTDRLGNDPYKFKKRFQQIDARHLFSSPLEKGASPFFIPF